MRAWSDWRERGVTGKSVEWQMRAWSDRCERGVTSGNVECRQECENDGEEVNAAHLGAARKALILSKIATFRVIKAPTLKVA